MDPRPTLPVADRCPLCGGSNRCANELAKASGQPQPPCWCTQAAFPRELLARVPAEAVGKACICPACAAGGAS